MSSPYSVTLAEIIRETALEVVYTPEDPETIKVCSCEVNRPGLVLSGYLDFFDNDRIQILGKNEMGFLNSMHPDDRERHVRDLVAFCPPAIVVTRGLSVLDELREACEAHKVPLLRTADTTSSFQAALIAYLNVKLAPRITRHGVLVEVYGEGVLLIGDSGVGKSETAVELVKRGHRLIADDAVEIRRVSAKSLVGTAPDNIRHFIELRGVGIINARRLFGMGSVKVTEKIDLVIELENWDVNKVYDRMGMENETMDILGITVPKLTIPVKPGRNLAIIIEAAAMNNRQKKMGFNAAKELMLSLGMVEDAGVSAEQAEEWSRF